MPIDISREGPVATITINNPDKLNALDESMLSDLLVAFTAVGKDQIVRAIVLTGAGDKAFVAGANIKDMASMDRDAALRFARAGHAVGSAIERAPQPVIAAVNGYAFGGGCELALACDMRICASNAVFSQPEVGLGIPPGWGGTQRLTALVGKGIASELIFSGRRVHAEEALRIGLVNAVHEPADLLDAAGRLATEIATNSPRAVRASKRLIARVGDGLPASGLAEEARTFASQFGGRDQREGMAAFVEKRAATFGDGDDT